MPIAFELQQGSLWVFTKLPNLMNTRTRFNEGIQVGNMFWVLNAGNLEFQITIFW
jgi:hypothetical protein